MINLTKNIKSYPENIIMKKEKYYYIRDNQNRPIITVCLLKRKNQIGRGVTICSVKDQPCKKVGRAIAKTRALFALASEKDNLEMVNGNFPLFAFDFGFYKSYYNPELTKYEQKLFRINDLINDRNEEGNGEEKYE